MSPNDTLTPQTSVTGFARAATAIVTDEANLISGPTTVPSQGDAMPAWLARPAGQHDALPVVIVVQEIFGIHQHIQDLCRRLAKEGYLAIAPELYFRQGDPTHYGDVPTLLAELVSKVPDSQVLSDLDHTEHFAATQGGDLRRLAITGFCWGGRISWLYAAHNPQLRATAAWYGKLTGDKTLTMPKHPVDVATQLGAPVLGLYGAQDGSIPLETIETMRQALRAANAEAEIVVYLEAGHAFNADYRPSYHAASAQDGLQRMLAWFARFGVK